MANPSIEAVLWDFGGVILTSPFDAFAAYERENGLSDGFIRQVNATNPHTNAWARLERAELDPNGFAVEFEDEARQLGGEVSGTRILELLAGEVRPEMVTALDRCRAAGLRTACLTNNIVSWETDGVDDPVLAARAVQVAAIMSRFDVVVESSVIGVRKPEARFYELACELLETAPEACVFLDDLGINLKPARAMGMTTIKVTDPAAALIELGAVLGLDLA
jgi:putative hydrolase of the HAD superfamily